MNGAFRERPKAPDRDCYVYTAHSGLDWDAVARLRIGVMIDRFGVAVDDERSDLGTTVLVMVDGVVLASTELVTGDGASERCRQTLIGPAGCDRTWPELPFGIVGGLVFYRYLLDDDESVLVDDRFLVPAVARTGRMKGLSTCH